MNEPQRFQFSLKAALVAVLFVGAGLGVIVSFLQYRNDPVAILKRNRERIMQYIDKINAGDVQKRNDNGYYILDVLHEAGVREVFKEEGCIVIRFEFMPTDPIPELVYSPKGANGMPERLKTPGERIIYFKSTKIDDNWTYVEWDN